MVISSVRDDSRTSLNIQGSAPHPHTVTLTADQVRSIGARTQVSVTSTTEDAHFHTVTFN